MEKKNTTQINDNIISAKIWKDISINIKCRGDKFWIGILMTIFTVILCHISSGTRLATIILVSGCGILAFINIECGERLTKWLNYTWYTFSAVVIFYSIQLLLNVGIAHLNLLKVFLGVLICSIILQLILMLTGNIRIAVLGNTMVLLLLAVIDYFVLRFRGSEISIADFQAIGTAISVAENYDYSIDGPFAYAVIMTMMYCYIGFCIPKFNIIRNKRKIIFKTCIYLCITFGLLGAIIPKMEAYHFTNEGALNNGFLLNFLCRIETAKVERPENYSASAIKDLETKYGSETIDVNTNEKLPHIIVIMNETFANLEVVGSFDTDVEVTPFFNSLRDNVIRGYALTSVFGGGTCNSEFEMLTGYTMGLLPQNSYPFQQFIQENTWSMVEALESMGYSSIGTHPQKGTNWMRSTVYPLLGFDEIYFLEDYPQENLLRGHVSDQEMYEQIISWYEEKVLNNEKLFLFGVTMQNHSPYNDFSTDFCNIVHLQNFDEEYPDVEQYLSLLKYSDMALEYLINYFDTQDEKVVVLFLGDHLPKIDDSFYSQIWQDNGDVLEQQMRKYIVPFFVWANYDIEEQDNVMTSLNYLSNYVYEAAGISFPAYNQFLSDVQDVMPVMNAFGYYSQNNKKFISYEAANALETELLNEYAILQYNGLFDDENRISIFNIAD